MSTSLLTTGLLCRACDVSGAREMVEFHVGVEGCTTPTGQDGPERADWPNRWSAWGAAPAVTTSV